MQPLGFVSNMAATLTKWSEGSQNQVFIGTGDGLSSPVPIKENMVDMFSSVDMLARLKAAHTQTTKNSHFSDLHLVRTQLQCDGIPSCDLRERRNAASLETGDGVFTLQQENYPKHSQSYNEMV
ncbi:hypothetical protein CRENBAI_007232 [Crenichthys baileyi]|uniref:Uncharacterized protein n=1 Tax=Crenichthys baileyi TaxID=28760 RepID=A0AAV9RL12_9TELE